MASVSLVRTSGKAASIAALALAGGSCNFCAATLLGVRQGAYYAETDAAAGRQMAELIASAEPPAPTAPPAAPSTCSVCLGIMQDGHSVHDPSCTANTPPTVATPAAPDAAPPSPMQVAADTLRSRGYDSARFTLGIQLPVSVPLRQHAMRAHICTALGLTRLPVGMVPVKDAVRQRLLFQLAQNTPVVSPDTAASHAHAGTACPGLVEDRDLTQFLLGEGDPPLPHPEGGLQVNVTFVHAGADSEISGLAVPKTSPVLIKWQGWSAGPRGDAAAGAEGTAPPAPKRPRSEHFGTTKDALCWHQPSTREVGEVLDTLTATELPTYIPHLLPLHMQHLGAGAGVEPTSRTTRGPAALHAFTPWLIETYSPTNGRAGKVHPGARGRGRTTQSLALRTGPDTLPVPSPPWSPAHPVHFTLKVQRTPLYLTGNYNKFERGVPQSPWGITQEEGGPTNDSALPPEKSVSGVVAGVLRGALGSRGVNMSSSGREDIDVRMLGAGRPFAVEVLDPTVSLVSPASVAALQAAMNENAFGVRISHLAVSSCAGYGAMQSGAEHKEKTYAALVWVSHPLTPEQLHSALAREEPLELAQRTPMRVMHRRALMTRTRHVTRMAPAWLAPHYFILHLSTTAGTYVKEFVHSDLGRTTPSVASLVQGATGQSGVTADILTLDVVHVDCPHLEGAGSGIAPPEFGASIPQVDEEAAALVAAGATPGGLAVHPLKGLVPAVSSGAGR